MTATTATLTRLRAWRPGGYLRASGVLLGWLLVRAAAQAVLVIALARLLGAAGYGHFIAVLAMATFFAPLAGLGLHGVVLLDGARKPSALPQLLATALGLWLPSTVIFSVCGAAMTLLVLPHGAGAFAIVALVCAEIASSSLVELLCRVQQALHHSQRYGAMLAGLALVRVAALAGYATLAHPTADGWMCVYAVSSIGYAAALLSWTYRAIRPARDAAPRWPMVRDGLPFALGASSMRLQAEFNKPVLAHLGYAEAGAFSVAQRMVDLVALPLTALQEALWPRIYAAAAPRARLRLTGGLLVLLALAAGVPLALAAPLLPWLLGADYAATGHALMGLTLLPAVQVVRNLGNAWLIAHGASQSLYLVYAAAAATGALLALLLVPRLSLTGAVWALYGSEAVAIGVQLVTSLRKGR